MSFKLVKESITEETERRRVPIAKAKWDDVKPLEDNSSIQMPYDFMSSLTIHGPSDFETYKEEFIDKYGPEGDFVEFNGFRRIWEWKIEGNQTWDRLAKSGAEGMASFYGTGSGSWTGD